jgi:hypothetical protein
MVSCFFVFTIRTMQALHLLHSPFIVRPSFLKPVTIVPQLGQCHLNTFHSSYFATLHRLLVNRVALYGDFLRESGQLRYVIQGDGDDLIVYEPERAGFSPAMLTYHPPVSFLKIQTFVHRAAHRAHHVILLHFILSFLQVYDLN